MGRASTVSNWKGFLVGLKLEPCAERTQQRGCCARRQACAVHGSSRHRVVSGCPSWQGAASRLCALLPPQQLQPARISYTGGTPFLAGLQLLACTMPSFAPVMFRMPRGFMLNGIPLYCRICRTQDGAGSALLASSDCHGWSGKAWQRRPCRRSSPHDAPCSLFLSRPSSLCNYLPCCSLFAKAYPLNSLPSLPFHSPPAGSPPWQRR